MINLSISNIAWNNADELQIFNILNQCKFNSIEIAPTKIWSDIYNCSNDDIIQYKKFVQNNKLNICAFQSLLFGEANLQVFDKNTWNKFFIRLERISYIAKLLGTKVLVFGSPKNRIKSTNSIDIESNSNNNDELNNNYSDISNSNTYPVMNNNTQMEINRNKIDSKKFQEKNDSSFDNKEKYNFNNKIRRVNLCKKIVRKFKKYLKYNVKEINYPFWNSF